MASDILRQTAEGGQAPRYLNLLRFPMQGLLLSDLLQALRLPLKLRCVTGIRISPDPIAEELRASVKAGEHSERSPSQYSESEESEEKAHNVKVAQASSEGSMR